MRLLNHTFVQVNCPGRPKPCIRKGRDCSAGGVGLTEATSKEGSGALVCAAETTTAHASSTVATRIIGPPSDSGVYFSSRLAACTVNCQPLNVYTLWALADLARDVLDRSPWPTITQSMAQSNGCGSRKIRESNLRQWRLSRRSPGSSPYRPFRCGRNRPQTRAGGRSPQGGGISFLHRIAADGGGFSSEPWTVDLRKDVVRDKQWRTVNAA